MLVEPSACGVLAAATQEQRIMLSLDGEARLTRCDGSAGPSAAKPRGVRDDMSWG
jgi:hypothetical protein